MQIYVQMPNGKTIPIDVQLDKITVLDVKKKVMEKTGIPLEDLIIIFNDNVLKNDKLLKFYEIKQEARLEAEKIDSFQEKFKQKLADVQEEVNRWQVKFAEEQDQKEALMNQLKQSQEERNKLGDLKGQLESDLQNARIQIESLMKKSQQAQELTQSQIRQAQNMGSKAEEQKKLELENSTLKALNGRLEIEIMEKTAQIDFIRAEKQQLTLKLDDFQKVKDELMEKKFELKSMQKELEFAQNRGNQTKEETQKDLDYARQSIRQLEQQIKELKDRNQDLDVERMKLDLKIQSDSTIALRLTEVQQLNISYEKRIADQKLQISALQDQVNQLQNTNQDEMRKSVNRSDYASVDKIQQYETKIARLTAEVKSAQQSFEESQQQLSQQRKTVFDNQKKIQELEKSVETLSYMLKEKERKIRELQLQIKSLEEDIQDGHKVAQIYKEATNEYKKAIDPKKVVEMDTDTLKVEERLKQREEQRKREEKFNEQQRQKEMESKQQKLQQEQQLYNDLMVKGKEQKLKTAQFLKKQMMETHGKIEVCFLIDVTGSMDPYKEQAMKCIRESMKNIKAKTNRDALWATVAYQDFGELKALGGLYKQFAFTQRPNEIEDFLRDLPCSGGGDAAEDVRGGIMQMIKNLNWSKTFKIAVLICDAPTHGKRYNGGVSDRYPNEDIQDAVELLIENNILLVGILFNKVTLQMFEEIKKIYVGADREELLLFADLANTDEGRIWQELVDLVSQASQRATQTNNKGTKSKNAQANKKSQSGAMEALCKTIKDPFQFDRLPGVTVVPAKFGVIRVEIKQEAFENNIENIKRLDLHRDYNVFQEGQWDCIRTEKFFAQGQMKQVFLMKRQSNQNELYVIKMPFGDTYKSQEDAIIECRSHLISKCLMKKFIRELQEARDKTDRGLRFPEPQYSDFLILKDLERNNSYWIAERYFNGEFVKYNNNFGFISDDPSDINNLAQAFTYYTYFISNFNYMVSDVQGVGNYFTDPALNTKEGSFDETDMGSDGHSMFMVNYEGKRHIGKKYLDLLKIE